MGVYIPVHLLGIWLIWSMEKQFFADVDWTEAPIVAMLAIFTLPTPFAVWVSLWVITDKVVAEMSTEAFEDSIETEDEKSE